MIEQRTIGTADEDRFVETMRHIREIQGLSQGELAARLAEAGWDGFRQTTVSRIEKGERTVRLAEAHAIAQVLGTSLARMTDETAQGDAQRIRELDGLIEGLEQQISACRQKLVQYQVEKHMLTAASGGPELEMPLLYRAYYYAMQKEDMAEDAVTQDVDYEA
ncbi:helix-turn-helix transcriptional regulator [Pseudarthrobacter sp. NPDC080039]|uniref:helix-turn-helix domain-containing protein n=1 Tax=unclassified Pseudarthrobacter TaxID=2647000 RepID=UPI00344B4598